MKKVGTTKPVSVLVIRVVLIIVSILLLACPPAPTQASTIQAAPLFYKNNIVKVIVPYTAGSSSDTSARFLATFWPKVTGGGKIIVENVAGAGAILGHNAVYSAKPDGLTIGTGNYGAQISPVLFGDPAVKHDPTKVNWLLGAFKTPWMLAVGTPKPYNSMADLQQAKGLKFGMSKRDDIGTIILAFLIEVFKLDAKIVLGYAGSTETGLACGRGEIDGTMHTAVSQRTQFDKGFEKKPPVIADRKRTEFWPDVPTLFELTKLTPEQEQLFAIIEGAANTTQPYYTPPGVPEDRVKFLREKLTEILADKEFRTQGEKYWKVWTEPSTGEELKVQASKVLAFSKEDVAKMLVLVNKYILAK